MRFAEGPQAKSGKRDTPFPFSTRRIQQEVTRGAFLNLLGSRGLRWSSLGTPPWGEPQLSCSWRCLQNLSQSSPQGCHLKTCWREVPLPAHQVLRKQQVKKARPRKKSPLPSEASLQHPLLTKPNIKLVGRRQMFTGSSSSVRNRTVKGDIEAERQYTDNWHS